MKFLKKEELKKFSPWAVSLIIVIAVGVFLYFYGNFLINLISEHFLEKKPLESVMPIVLNIVFLVIGTEIFLIISRFFASKYLERGRRKKEVKIILSIYTYFVWGIVLIILVASFFKDVGALLTSVGLIGFGITFALQKPILNFVGWITIFVANPFKAGDRIEVSGTRGDVISIHTMYTRIHGTRSSTQDKGETIITLPNEFILTNPVINYSRTGELYADEITFSITYESNWKKASEILEKVTANAIKKYAKKELPTTKAEKESWEEAIKLLQEASKKIKKGFAKESLKESIYLMKSAESSAELEIAKSNIEMSLTGSSINLCVDYQTDLHSVRATKHEIVKSFLEEVEKTKDIEIAYPHMQIVAEGKTTAKRKGSSKNILSYMLEQAESKK